MARPGLPHKNDFVYATSTRDGLRQKTAHALLDSSDKEERALCSSFLRKVWALLVLQYAAVLVMTSPFGLIETFQSSLEPHHSVLQVVAITGIVASIGLALVKGSQWPFAQICLVSVTFFVALELGLLFAHMPWGRLGLVALGQATTSFAIILALLQFDMDWLGYAEAAVCCLGLAGMWIVVMLEGGTTWPVSVGVGLGGWVFAMVVLVASYQVSKYVSPDEYVLAVLFILKPAAVVFLSSKQRKPGGDCEEEERLVQVQSMEKATPSFGDSGFQNFA